jgi:toxin ParE1/3/4
MVQKIIWTKESLNNLSDIKDYISNDSEYYALKTINLIYLAAQKLLKFPEIGMVINKTADYYVRRVLIKSYRLLYIIKDENIFVIAVYHQLRQLPQSFNFPDTL